MLVRPATDPTACLEGSVARVESGRGVLINTPLRDGAAGGGVIDCWIGPMGERRSSTSNLEGVDVKELEGVIVKDDDGETDVLLLLLDDGLNV